MTRRRRRAHAWFEPLIFALMALALYLLMHVSASGDEPTLAEPQSFHPARNVSVIDGDTIVCDYHLWGPFWAIGDRVRSDYDTWEARRVRNSAEFKAFTEEDWESELAKGARARQALIDLLEQGDLYLSFSRDPRGMYGRTIARYYVRTKDELIDVELWMAKHGHLRTQAK